MCGYYSKKWHVNYFWDLKDWHLLWLFSRAILKKGPFKLTTPFFGLQGHPLQEIDSKIYKVYQFSIKGILINVKPTELPESNSKVL